MWITPNYQDTDFNWPLSLDDKITVFQDRTLGWQLALADRIINREICSEGAITIEPIRHSGYAILHIVLSYFEMIAKFFDGFSNRGRSEHYFREGVYSVFPILRNHPQAIVNELLSALYGGGRCGLYHGGMTDSRIILTGDLDAVVMFDSQNNKLVINPHRLVPVLIAHFRDYITQLKDQKNGQLRNNFEQRFDYEGH